jgi:GNAT superfamily N-acetyltransferase
MQTRVEVVQHDPGDPAVVEEVLRELPEWFGIEEAIRHYAAHAGRSPTYTATMDGEAVGVLVLTSHTPESAEHHLLAVRRAWHRRGIGRALVTAAERDLAAAGVAFLQVKTLGPSRPDPHYDLTRRFYLDVGYVPLEEHAADTLWDGNPCLVLVKHLPCT